MQVITPIVPKGIVALGAKPKFGLMNAEEESKIFALLPVEAQASQLINQYEDLERGPFGFYPASKLAERQGDKRKVEDQLLQLVKSPAFTKEHAVGMLAELYQNRDELVHQLPKEIFNVVYAKATAKSKAPPREVTEADNLPPAIRKRLGRDGGVQRLVLPAEALKELFSAAAQKTYGGGGTP